MKISIIGTGYVGLVTGVCLAEVGNEVWCVDSDKDKIHGLNNLNTPIYEPGLDEMVEANYKQKRLKFTFDIKDAIENTDYSFISVGTPSNGDGSGDLRQVLDVAGEIGRYLRHHMYVVCKSTVPVGTAEKVREIIQNELNKRNSSISFDVISNPEFLRQGVAINDCMNPDRIVIGTDNEKALAMMKEVYRPFIRSTEDIISMDIKSAEMTKYVANSMLAAKISFMNEMANICEKVGADINKVRVGIGSDERIGHSFIYPGCGYGGSCFPKDVSCLINVALDNNYEPKILKAVKEVNEKQKHKIPEKIIGKYGLNLEGRTFAVWGLAFKPDTDDMRGASSITIINELTLRGAKVKAYDPKSIDIAKDVYLKGNDSMEYFKDKYEALVDADALILITEWGEFKSPDFNRIKEMLKAPVIFDGRNQYDMDTLKALSFQYYQIGVRNDLEESNI